MRNRAKALVLQHCPKDTPTVVRKALTAWLKRKNRLCYSDGMACKSARHFKNRQTLIARRNRRAVLLRRIWHKT